MKAEMEGNLPVSGWNAHRRPQDPIRQPRYLMELVPKAVRDLQGSQIYEIQNRDQFKEAMAEMVLLCTEALRRTTANRCSSKPLSLEYIADRLDVDDPCFGYVIRSDQGMLQGFITVTTFTNWQKTFRWDSLHELAFYYDDSDSEQEEDNDKQQQQRDSNIIIHGPTKRRRVDRDGSLARELETTVRQGDPYGEGIVWPRIAEISLLGALGCGRTLVQLIIEQLEFQKPTAMANYDYIALQATDNSIPFYESIGFIRVGAVTVQTEEKSGERSSSSSSSTTSSSKGTSRTPSSSSSSAAASVQRVSTGSDTGSASVATAEPVPHDSPEKPDSLAVPIDLVSSPLTTYEVMKPGETPTQIAKHHGVAVWDIIFLNKDLDTNLSPSSRLRRGTLLKLPVPTDSSSSTTKNDNFKSEPTKWYIAKENDTPKMIAKKLNLPCKKVVDANRVRLPELMASSRLKAGTRIKISNLDRQDDICEPYCHWSFPDDSSVDGGEPSYMMIYRLNRKGPREPKTIRQSLAVPIQPYSPAPLLHSLPAPKTKILPFKDCPIPPPSAPRGADIFMNHLRSLYPEFATRTTQNTAELENRWRNLPKEKKDRYEAVAKDTRKPFEEAQEEYQTKLKAWQEECKTREPIVIVEKEPSLFNKVIKLRKDAPGVHEYSYWFVLTYIPDLMWCHLAPMIQDGVIGAERQRSEGRPKYRLVDEGLGKELDISSSFCIPVRSKALKKTADADKEEWDILDDNIESSSTNATSSAADPPTLEGRDEAHRKIRKQPMRARSVMKPMGGKLAVVVKPPPQGVVVGGPNSPPRRSSMTTTSSSTNSPTTIVKRTRICSPPTTPKRSWTTSPKHTNDMEDMAPSRKARRISSSGARRCALQS